MLTAKLPTLADKIKEKSKLQEAIAEAAEEPIKPKAKVLKSRKVGKIKIK